MANTFNKTSISREYLWHGCKAPIPLSPHLVAIGYPDPDRSSFFGLLSSFGEVREDTSHNIAYFHYREQLVFLFTQDNLATIQKIICSEGGKLAQVRQPQHENPILPLPAHLMLREVYSNYRHTPDYNCYPLKEQLADNRQALSKLLDSPILR